MSIHGCLHDSFVREAGRNEIYVVIVSSLIMHAESVLNVVELVDAFVYDVFHVVFV